MTIIDVYSHWGTKRGYVLQTEAEIVQQGARSPSSTTTISASPAAARSWWWCAARASHGG